MPRHIVCLTFDFDTQSGHIARGLTTPTWLSRGEFGLIGARRIVDFLKSRDIKATFFTAGFTIDSYPQDCERVVAAGHEIGHHSWAHIPPANQTHDEEEADIVRAKDSIVRLTGKAPVGYRSPSWDLSDSSIELLIKHGIQYDSSLMGADYIPYRARRGDHAKLGDIYKFGEETSLIEMPISWSLDDHPHFEYMRMNNMIAPGLQSARIVMDNWRDEFSYMKKTVDWGIVTYTMHPYVIGRGYRMFNFEKLVDDLEKQGAVFMTMEQAAAEAKAKLFS